mmetsp:Transcript_71945/g.127146  ORF Transcript_71945/g.127146 Transcript_71945/m.127146 type:complete len:221 (-) Transcript_71945:302-964(-)
MHGRHMQKSFLGSTDKLNLERTSCRRRHHHPYPIQTSSTSGLHWLHWLCQIPPHVPTQTRHLPLLSADAAFSHARASLSERAVERPASASQLNFAASHSSPPSQLANQNPGSPSLHLPTGSRDLQRKQHCDPHSSLLERSDELVALSVTKEKLVAALSLVASEVDPSDSPQNQQQWPSSPPSPFLVVLAASRTLTCIPEAPRQCHANDLRPFEPQKPSPL